MCEGGIPVHVLEYSSLSRDKTNYMYMGLAEKQ